ncbi:MAG: hypothetical protein AB2A00_01675 [Myxococcota bacterium]
MAQLAQDIQRILLATDAAGRRKLSRDQVLVVAAISIYAQHGDDVSKLSADEKQVLDQLATRSGAAAEKTVESAQAKITAFMKQNPIPPDVEAALMQRMREAVGSGELQTAASRKAAMALIGGGAPAAKAPAPGPRPAGTVAAGPLAAALLASRGNPSKQP